MHLPFFLTAAIYILVLIIGTVTATVTIVNSVRIDLPIYRVTTVLTVSLLLYTVFDFAINFIHIARYSYNMVMTCIFLSDIFYITMVAAWLIQIGYLAGNYVFIKPKIIIWITIIYGVVVEFFVLASWLFDGTLINDYLTKDNLMQIILFINVAYELFVFVCGAIYLYLGISKVKGRTNRFFIIALSGLYLLYLIWILYFDININKEGFGVVNTYLRLDPIMVVFMFICIIVLVYFYRRYYKGFIPYKEVVAKERSGDEIASILKEKYKLTGREIDVAKLVQSGKSNPEVAKSLFISENTAKHHLNHIFQKTGAKNRYELISILNSTI